MILEWGVGIAVAAAAALLLMVPGLLVTVPLRLGVVERTAIAGVAAVFALGSAGIAGAAVGVAWAPWHPLVPAAVGAGLMRWLAPARRRRSCYDEGRHRGWVIGVWALAAAALFVIAFAEVPDPSRVSQTYDNVFHMSAIADIIANGDASSLTLRTLIQTDAAFAYYPSAWHSLVASTSMTTGASTAVSANAAWLAVVVMLWMPGVVWLAQVLVRPVRSGVVALVAFPLSVAFGAMPYGLLSWGTLYPTAMATAVLPAAIALPLVIARRAQRTTTGRRWRLAAIGSLAVGAAIFAIAFAQPRVLASWALLIVPAAVFGASRIVAEAWRAGGVHRARAVRFLAGAGATLTVAAVAALVYVIKVLGLFDRPLGDRLGGPQAQATQSVWDGLLGAVAQSWPTGVGGGSSAPALLLAAAVLVGMVWAARLPRLRWVVVAYAAVVILFALAAGSDAVFAKLATAVWYKDRYRLSSVVPILGVVLASLGVIVAGERLSARLRRSRRRSRRWSVGLSAVVAASSVGGLALTGATAAIGEVFRMPSAHAGTAVVSAAQIDFFGRLAAVVPDDQRVLGDPWDGSAWTLVYGDREPVFPHVNGSWDADRAVLAHDLAAVDTDPRVCKALDRLRVRYVVYSDHALAGGDPAGNLFPGPHAAVEAGLFSLVAAAEDSALYRIDQCGPLPPAADAQDTSERP